MTDYSASSNEPIVEGLVTFVIVGGVPEPVFNGRGISAISRLAGFPLGVFVLQLDEGLPGNSGAVPPGAGPFLNPNVRTMVTMRGDPAAVPPVTNIQTTAVNYLVSPVVGVGSDRILIVTRTNPPAFADPVAGFEIIVWRVNG